jgi:CBS domain-containing protein
VVPTDLHRAEAVHVREVMTREVVCLEPGMDLDATASLFLERGISGAPVVDPEGRPIGMVTKTDLMRAMHDGTDTEEIDTRPGRPSRHTRQGGVEVLDEGFALVRGRGAAVRDIMTPVAFTLSESAPLARAAALMAFEGVHRVPIVSVRGAVVGIVSALDVVRWLAREEGYLVPAASRGAQIDRDVEAP